MELATWSIEEIMWLLVEGQKKLNKSFDIWNIKSLWARFIAIHSYRQMTGSESQYWYSPQIIIISKRITGATEASSAEVEEVSVLWTTLSP
jgi:hypothetical protein